MHGEPARPALVAEDFQHIGRRADETQSGLLALARKVRVLAQEPVARVNRVAACRERNADDLRRVEVSGRALPDQRMRLVRLADVIGLCVVLGENRMGTHFGFRGGAGDANGDLAAVGDEKVADCHGFTRGFEAWEFPVTPRRSPATR